MSLIAVVSPVNAHVFTEYIRPRLQQFVSVQGIKMKPFVRATYASCLSTLAHTSSRILDMVQALRADGSIPTIDPEAEDGAETAAVYQNLFDVAKQDLLEHFEAHTKALLTDSTASVRRAFLGSVSSLCVFFGSSKANDVILSHLNTYLNDKDWMLKCAFFHTIVGVATFVGGTSLEEFILPLMIQALTDSEEFVVAKVLSSFASMADLGLFQRAKIWEMVDIIARFMMHPNVWIREAAANFVASATRYLSEADIHCIISPLLQPYLKVPLTNYSETSILDALKKPLSRQVLDMAATWAGRSPGGIFWKSGQQERTFSFASPEQALHTVSSKGLQANSLSKIARSDEDDQWLAKLRNIGMAEDDEFKLLSLREYIWRMASRRSTEGDGAPASPLNNIINLKEMNVTPQTVFFEVRKKSKVRRRRSHGEHQAKSGGNTVPAGPHSIADALLDASTTIDNPLAERKKSNVRKDRINRDFSPRPTSLDSKRGASSLNSPLSTPPNGRPRSRDSSALASDFDIKRTSHKTPKALDQTTASDGTGMPIGPSRSGTGPDRISGLKHKGSAINLLNKKDTIKTSAETGTTSANVLGRLDGPFTQEFGSNTPISKPDQEDQNRSISETRAGHSYDGNDPNVIKLLDSLASENYPLGMLEFGPMVSPIGKGQTMKRADIAETEKPWRPEGVLVALFGEHTGAINRVLPSPDHAFFITASDDGTVKIWDTLRLERNLTHRSRQTHRHAAGTKVKCITFVENTHSFISCATDGSINIVKVDYVHTGDSSRYGKLRLVREYQLPNDEYVVWVEHFKFETNSIMLVATNTSEIVAIDLRNMAVLYSFQNPLHHGTPTCFCVDKKHSWVLLGTSHGILDLWDLRFRLRLKTWGLSGGTPIFRLQVHPFKGRGKWVCITGGTGQTDITVWDLEKAQCREVFRAGIPRNSSKDNLKTYEAWKVDEEKAEGMLARFATAIELTGAANGNLDRGIRALAIGLDAPDDGREAKHGFFLTGGSDKKLRFWDIMRVEASTVISGLDADEEQPKYTSTHPTTTLTLNSERAPQPGPSAPNAAAGNKPSSANTAKKAGTRPPRSTVISLQQQQLLRSHLDTILDVALLESPIGMTVSVDRAGIIYVFQ
jgi:phosphoinositide-3-kinase, regulatory subunit 4